MEKSRTKFEFTSPGSPQKNRVIEIICVVLYCFICAMNSYVELPEKYKSIICCKSTRTSTNMANLMVETQKSKSPL